MHAGFDSRMTMIPLPPVADNDEDDDASKIQAEAGDVYVVLLHFIWHWTVSVAVAPTCPCRRC